jgi:hypothetical protein
MPRPLHEWGLDELRNTSNERLSRHRIRIQALENGLTDADRNLRALTDLRLRHLIDDSEFVEKRVELQQEALRLRQAIAHQQQSDGNWFEPARSLLSFSNRAVSWFTCGDIEAKRLVVHTVGSNLTLKDKILNVEARKPFRRISKNMKRPELLAVVKDIRTMVDDPEFQEMIRCIHRLEEKMEGRRLEVA